MVTIRLRNTLFAGVSASALMVGSAQLQAEMALPPGVCRPAYTMFLEGGAFWTDGGAINHLVPPAEGVSVDIGPTTVDLTGFTGIFGTTDLQPGVGWTGAIGFDWHFGCSPWHLSTQFRYGESGKTSKHFNESSSFEEFFADEDFSAFVSGEASASATVQHREEHLVADFMAGRDLGVGRAYKQLKFGLRVAGLQAITKSYGEAGVAGEFSVFSGEEFEEFFSGGFDVSLTETRIQKSRFLGVGPRIALEGSHPLGPVWSLDYGVGAAALFGKQRLTTTVEGVTSVEVFGTVPKGVAGASAFSFTERTTKQGTVFNLDLSLGLTYRVNENFSITGGYRFDGYWDALLTADAEGGIKEVDRFFHGPFMRATIKFGASEP